MLPIISWWICSRYHKIWWPMYATIWSEWDDMKCIIGRDGGRAKKRSINCGQLLEFMALAVWKMHIMSFESSSIGCDYIRNAFSTVIGHILRISSEKNDKIHTKRVKDMKRNGKINRYRPKFADVFLSPVTNSFFFFLTVFSPCFWSDKWNRFNELSTTSLRILFKNWVLARYDKNQTLSTRKCKFHIPYVLRTNKKLVFVTTTWCTWAMNIHTIERSETLIQWWLTYPFLTLCILCSQLKTIYRTKCSNTTSDQYVSGKRILFHSILFILLFCLSLDFIHTVVDSHIIIWLWWVYIHGENCWKW